MRVSDRRPRDITYLRLSVTDRCGLSCAYCRPRGDALGHADSPLSLSEIATLVRAFAELGVTKVRLTGGEPLLRRDIVEIVETVARTPGIATVGLTTNGIGLESAALDLARAGLLRLNISIDSLNRDTFRRITGADALEQVMRGLDAALRRGFEEVKVNTVALRGLNDSELPAIADLARTQPVDVRFIELMPLGHSTSKWAASYVPAKEIASIVGIPEERVRPSGSTASLYAPPGWRGSLGIISPMSDSFCGECNRVRVTCTGKLKPCLRLPVEEDIRPYLDRPRLAEKLDEILGSLKDCKPTESHEACAVESPTMCCVGG